ncbi:hypothetical protein GCM10009127_09450 [Alteraurantiacibacter aestuarii]|uniref:TIGR00341 family protein n=1 Tax=Alteraurantiacibacter aestuarii TaxID=650004 RepID=A0A844ZIS2_9SPHN|nr:TIGR00341 family protein [Alteraurantiacibacter aestuarii]MXO87333.1 TIGR00341 family protein [Alteraurantiacibacter aestuarii]
MASDAPAGRTENFGRVVRSWQRWWRSSVTSSVDQAAVIEKRRAECELSSRYLLMISMSAGIAILGLLLSSPAVVIGAMLLSPLMDPIMGVGFALAVGDFQWLRQSARSLAIGTLFAVLFCAIVVFMSPLQTLTSEIAARTRPNIFDLLVALFSAVAGGYAIIRGREGTIVGVAIATALMPPLAVVGYGLATFNWTVFSGALLLFVTNLMTIALTAAVMARLYGFRTNLSEKQTHLQSALILLAFVTLAIPLYISLRQIVWETNATRQINSVVLEAFDDRARLSQIETNLNTEPIQVSATVLTPELNSDAERITARAMSRTLGEPVDVQLTQYRVGTSAQAAEQAQLSATLARQEADLAKAETLADRLALIAGVSTEAVTVDRERRRATVTARPLEGATLGAYRELERRIASREPDWNIRLIPPARALPRLAFNGEEMAPSAQQGIGLIEWAVQRVGLPVRLEGRRDAVELVRLALAERGVVAQTAASGGGYGDVSVVWSTPEE